jgi:hypothetical protein
MRVYPRRSASIATAIVFEIAAEALALSERVDCSSIDIFKSGGIYSMKSASMFDVLPRLRAVRAIAAISTPTAISGEGRCRSPPPKLPPLMMHDLGLACAHAVTRPRAAS